MDKIIQGLSFGVLFIITFIVISFLYTFIHELGHVIAMLLVGFKVVSFVVFAFVFSWTDYSYKFKVDFSRLKQSFGHVQPNIQNVHSKEQYNKLLPKLMLVSIGGNLLEIVFIIILICCYNVLSVGTFRICVQISTWTMIALSFIFNMDLIGVYKICTDHISKEICIYEWSKHGPEGKNIAHKIALEEMLRKYEYIAQNANHMNENIVLQYYNLILDYAIKNNTFSLKIIRIAFLYNIYYNIKLIENKNLILKKEYLKILYKYLSYLYITQIEDCDKIKEIYSNLQLEFSAIVDSGIRKYQKRMEYILEDSSSKM